MELHPSQEVAALRKKVVSLETAEADNEKLRKELNQLKVAAVEQKSHLELDFLNQLTGVARENALKLEELEGQLNESKKINLALSDKLEQSPSPEAVKERLETLDAQHKKDLAHIIDTNKAEVESGRLELGKLTESRDKLANQLNQVKERLSQKEKEITRLKDQLENGLSKDEAESLRDKLFSIQKSRDDAMERLDDTRRNIASKEREIQSLTSKLKLSEERLEKTVSDLDNMKDEKEKIQRELEEAREIQEETRMDVAHRDSAEIIKLQKTVSDLSAQTEKAKSYAEQKDLEIEALKANHISSQADMRSELMDTRNENLRLKAKIQEVENALLEQKEILRASEQKVSTEENNREEHLQNQLEKERAEYENLLKSLHRRLEANQHKHQAETRQLNEKLEKLNIESAKDKKDIARLRDREGDIRDLQEKNDNLLSSIRRLEVEKEETRKITSPPEKQVKKKNHFEKQEHVTDSTYQGKRTTQIIKKLEQNLKKEGQSKQTKLAGLKTKTFDEQKSINLQEELAVLQKTLNAERNQTNALRKEVLELKANIPSVTERRTSFLNSAPNTPTPLKAKKDDVTSRTPVRGIVENFEMKISSVAKRSETDTCSFFDSDNMEELKDALHFETQQVFELEDELTRQCEINCTLLKEISSLTKELEKGRSRNVATLNGSSTFGKNKVEKISLETSKLKDELRTAETEKMKLSEKFKQTVDSDRKQIQSLNTEIRSLKDKIRLLEEQVSKNADTSSSLSAKIIDLENKLSTSHKELSRLEQENSLKQNELKEQNASLLNLKEEIDLWKTKSKTEKAAHEAEITELSSTKESLQNELEKSTKSFENSVAEKEEIRTLQASILKLEDELKTSQLQVEKFLSEKQAHLDNHKTLTEKLQDLTKDLQTTEKERDDLEQKCRTNHVEKLGNLSSQIESLTLELKLVTEERDDLQDQNVAHTKKFDSIQAEIDTKVEDFQKIRLADEEEILRLRNEVNTLEKDLQSSYQKLKLLQSSLDEDKLKAQQNAMYQVNTLQKDLEQANSSEAVLKQKVTVLEETLATNAADLSDAIALKKLETLMEEKENNIQELTREKEQLVLSMKDMTSSRRTEIDHLQHELTEMSTRAANQAREVQTLKIQLEDSEHRKDEIDRLRKRVRELSKQATASSIVPVSDEKTSDLQIENSKLRQRLQDANLSLKIADEKLRDLVSEKGNSKAMQVLRDRNVSLKFEVEKLTRKLQKIADRRQKEQGFDRSKSGEGQSIPSGRYSYGSVHSASEDFEAARFMI